MRDIREGIFKTAVQAFEHEKLFGSRDKLHLVQLLVELVREDAFKLSGIDKSMLEVSQKIDESCSFSNQLYFDIAQMAVEPEDEVVEASKLWSTT